jgi:predicted transcriptional regulator
MNPLSLPLQTPAMDAPPSEETRRFLRQFFLIRYNSLIQRIKSKIPDQLDDETTQNLTDTLANVAWIDETLDEVKAVPSLY